MSAISKIEYMYWPGPVLIPHNYNMHVDNLRQVSQITYYGPFGTQYIYIDYDEECDDIYIRADVVYSVDAGNVLHIQDDVFLYDITVGEILELILGQFDVCVTWTENGRPDSVLGERVFQAPLSKIEVYYAHEDNLDTLELIDSRGISHDCCPNCDRMLESQYNTYDDY